MKMSASNNAPFDRKVLLIVQGSFAVSVLVYALIGYFLARRGGLPGRELTFPGSPYLKWVLLTGAVLLYPVLKKLQRSLQAPLESRPVSPEEGKTAAAVIARNYFILFALSEIPAIFGLVLFFLGYPLKTLLLACGLSIFYLASMTPPEGLFARR